MSARNGVASPSLSAGGFNWQIIHTHIDSQLNGIGDLRSASCEISLASGYRSRAPVVSAALKSRGIEDIRVNRSRIQKRKTRRARDCLHEPDGYMDRH